MPHQIFECDYCNFRNKDVEKVEEHEKEHIKKVEVIQIRSDGEEIPATLAFSRKKNGCLRLTFSIETEESSRTYKYKISAEEYEQLQTQMRKYNNE